MPPFLTYILRPILFFAVTVLMFVIQRVNFMGFYPEIYSGVSAYNRWQAVLHGLSMDCSVAGYLTAIPLLLSMVCIWLPEKIEKVNIQMSRDRNASLEMTTRETLLGRKFIKVFVISYSVIVSLVLSIIAVLDGQLYPIWGFKLDYNPFYYLMSSPDTVRASVSTGQLLASLGIVLGFTVIWFTVYFVSWNLIFFKAVKSLKAKVITFAGLVLMGGVLFVVIRGGVTVSTMNLSRAYFSSDQRLNHAAINPAFSLLSSVTRNISDAEKYNFYPDAQLPELLSLVATPAIEGKWDNRRDYLSVRRPDVYIIILESFSSHLLPSQGGENIAVNIDREARDGLLFTNAYAAGFRTDRGIPAIINAFPGLPDTGITKDTNAVDRLPSIGTSLQEEGYKTSYYYGGDLNFTNMNALLVAGDFEKIVGDVDFPYHMRSSKWGVADHNLFEMVKKELPTKPNHKPRLTVVQTSSSHEPFNVPYQKFANPAVNAFAYTDSVVGDFMKTLRTSPFWDRSLVVLVPDHYGAYPQNLQKMEDRHHIPIIFTGGALKQKGTDDVLMSQTDIVPTILDLMGLDYHRYFFGRNVLNRNNPQMVYYYDREKAFFKSAYGTAVIDANTLDFERWPSEIGVKGVISPFNPCTQLKAWMQSLSNFYNIQ